MGVEAVNLTVFLTLESDPEECRSLLDTSQPFPATEMKQFMCNKNADFTNNSRQQ